MSFLARPGAILLIVLALTTGVAACGSGATPVTTDQGASTPAPPEANNGETPVTAYIDARFHYRIDAPGHMTANPDGTASVIGTSERMLVTGLQGGAGTEHNVLRG